MMPFARAHKKILSKILFHSLLLVCILLLLSFFQYVNGGPLTAILTPVLLTLFLTILFINRARISVRSNAILLSFVMFALGVCYAHSLDQVTTSLLLFLLSSGIASLIIGKSSGKVISICGAIIFTVYFKDSYAINHQTNVVNSIHALKISTLLLPISIYLYLCWLIGIIAEKYNHRLLSHKEALLISRSRKLKTAHGFNMVLNQVIKNLPISVVWKDENLRFQGANELYLREHGFDEYKDIISKTTQDILEPDEAETHQEIERAIIQGERERYRYKTCNINPDGTTVNKETYHIAMRNEGGGLIGILVASLDINQIIKATKTASLNSTEVDTLQSAKSQFLANISHEVKTPINGLQGNLAMLGNTDISIKQQKYIDNAERSVSVLSQVLSDLVDLSQIEAGELKIERVPFDIVQLINKITNVYTEQCEEKGLNFIVEFEHQDFPAFISDPSRIYQILANLLSNAVKFTSKGSVTVKIRIDIRLGAAFLRVRVIDTGIGIDSHYIPTLFDTFTQADTSRNRKHGGTGLGLAVVKRLIEKLNGNISVTSQLAIGSEFSVSLPLVASKRAGDKINASRKLKRLKLLLVEDNSINQEIALSMLDSKSFDVCIANDGIEALNAVQTDSFDLVLMDIQMPNMDGLTATIEIRKAHPKEKLPIIALTANVMDSDINSYMENGFNGHVSKPYSKKLLLDNIRDTVCELIDRRTASYF